MVREPVVEGKQRKTTNGKKFNWEICVSGMGGGACPDKIGDKREKFGRR